MGRRYTPVVIGVGDVKNKSTRLEDAHEPARLMLQSIAEAIKDTKLSPSGGKELQSKIDSIHVVNTWSWAYPNLPGLLAEKLGVNPSYKVLSHHGGDSPAKLFDEAARRVSFGQAKVAIVTGGESLASLAACAAAGQLPPPGWTERDKTGKVVSPSDLTRRGQNLGTQHYIGLPIHVYPLYENAFRAFRNQSIEDNNNESGHLYGEFARIAERNPVAWNFGKPAASEADIKTVSKKNRMICYPYPLLMNAFNNVNLSGSCILTSTEYAKELGIPESHWIYPLGGAGTQDSDNFWERPNFYSSPAISRSLDAGLEASGLTKEDIDVYDLYSCFPIVPKLACHHLKMSIASPPKPITILGGLTSFGGAGNNYSMHAITELVRQLREGKYQNGLVLANGGVITYQHVVCLSSKPRKDNAPYPEKNPLPERTTDWFVPNIEHPAEGEGRIETYTVEFNRDGSPLRGHIVGRMRGSPERFLANHGDESTLMQLANSTKEQIGRLGWVKPGEDGRNLFVFDENAKL